jgi:DNA-binding MarR family transcriptional regulator
VAGVESRDAASGDEVGLLIALMGRMRERFTESAARLALTHAQAQVLLRLDEPRSQRDLARFLNYDASNISAIVDCLEAACLVERKVDSADRRIRRVGLTKQGAGVARRLRDTALGDASLLEALTAEERSQLRQLLRKVVGRDALPGWLAGGSLVQHAEHQ